MKNKMLRSMSKVVSLAMVASMFATVMPAHAAGITDASDTLSRLKVSVEASHTLAFTIPALTVGQTIIFTYTDFSAATDTTPPVCTPQSGTFTEGLSGNVLTLTADGSVGSGAVTCTTFDLTNPGSSGTTTVSVTGTGVDGSSMNLSIMDDDQVSITADISPTMSFDLDVSTGDIETASTYTVDLGILAVGSVSSSDHENVESIWIDLATNATGGATVTVQNNGEGLKSTSAPTDVIDVTTTALTAGTEGYGICVASTTESVTPVSATLTAAAEFDETGCDISTGHDVGLLSSTAADILTVSGPIASGRAEVLVKAAISTSTPAHPDYTDTLTFIATATY